MKDKTLTLSIFGLAIIAVGSVVVCAMGWPWGLLVLLPCAIPLISQIYRWNKKNKK